MNEKIPSLDQGQEEQLFSVSAKGAHVVSLHNNDGVPILFDKTELDGKSRGGSHVCLPNFGPDASGRLLQHGFGRDSEWRIIASRERQIATLDIREGAYTGLSAAIIYEASDAEFTTYLDISNTGDRPLQIAPGFHPYFAVNPDDIRLDGKVVSLDDYREPHVYEKVGAMDLQTDDRVIHIASDTLTTFVVWSDMKGDYLCIEPTLTGGGFDAADASTGIMLQPGEKQEYSYSISWSALEK